MRECKSWNVKDRAIWEEKERRDKMFCKKCGTELPDHAVFCKHCGEKVSVVENKEIERAKKKSGYALILGIVCVMAVVIGGGAFIIGKKSEGIVKVSENSGKVSKKKEEKYVLVNQDDSLFRDGELYNEVLRDCVYDDHGNQLREEVSDDKGGDWTEEYMYDEMGKKIAYFYQKSDVQEYWEQYKYDEQGNVILQITYDEDGEESGRKGYIYDQQGNCVKESTYSGDVLKEEIFYEFDADNQLTQKSYESDGRKTCYLYDSEHRLIETQEYGEDGSLSYTEKFSYKQKVKNPFKSVKEYANGSSADEETVYQYNDKGKKVKEERRSNGNVQERSVWKYDNHGNLIKYVNQYFEPIPPSLEWGEHLRDEITYEYKSVTELKKEGMTEQQRNLLQENE